MTSSSVSTQIVLTRSKTSIMKNGGFASLAGISTSALLLCDISGVYRRQYDGHSLADFSH